MAFKNFRINCSIRVILLTITTYLLFYFYYNDSLIVLTLITALINIYQAYKLIRYIEKTNRDLIRFLQAIKFNDFSQKFSGEKIGPSFKELSNEFSKVIDKFLKARTEKEEHFRYLQTVVEHVGIGVICFQQNGEVELINKSAKKLLNIHRLKNINLLKGLSNDLVSTLLKLKSGDRTLIKIDDTNLKMQLAINSTEFIMRNTKFTLISIQDIQQELENEKMTRELEIAHQVQMKLLPKENPQYSDYDIAGICIPAQEVGGDYYDFINLSDEKIGLGIGDVSGKGVPAAIYMTLTKGILQSLAEKTISPKNVLIQVNNLMYQSMERGSFVSMFYAILDTTQRKLICSRAGHNPAIHFHSQRNNYSLIQPNGMAIGLDAGKIFDNILSEQEIKLDKGDVIILYTDGFTEAMNIDQNLYGEKRLLQCIKKNKNKSANGLIEALCQDVIKFTNDFPQYDDMTMIVLKVK